MARTARPREADLYDGTGPYAKLHHIAGLTRRGDLRELAERTFSFRCTSTPVADTGSLVVDLREDEGTWTVENVVD